MLNCPEMNDVDRFLSEARKLSADARNELTDRILELVPDEIDPAIDEASTSLGASGLTTFRTITLPLIRPALLSGLTYAFARAMTTLSPIIFITTPQTKIMTSQILSEVDSGRFGNAFAYCTILIVIVLTVIGLMNLLVRDRRPKTRIR